MNEVTGVSQSLPIESQSGTALAGTNTTLSVAVSDQKASSMAVAGKVDLTDIFTQDVLLTRVSIANTDNPLINSLGVYDPWSVWLVNPLVLSRLTGMRWIRGEMVITAYMACPGACMGAYNLQALCEAGLTGSCADDVNFIDSSTYDAYFSSVQDTFGMMNCEMQNTIQIELPFVYPLEALSTVAADNTAPMWRLLLWPLSPIQSTIATTAIGTISIYARLKPGYTIETRVFQGKKEKQMFPTPGAASRGGPVSSIASGATKVIGAVASVIPAIAPMAAPIMAGLSVVSKVADFFGFTRESAPMMPHPMKIQGISTMANVDGTDPSDVLALYSNNTVTIDSSVAGGQSEDQMSFASLFERWHVYGKVTITEATPVGLVYALPVTPFFPATVLGKDYWSPTAFCGLPFSYWHGDMEYLLYIPSAPNVKGAMQIFWSTKIDQALTRDPTPYMEGTMIDLCGSSLNHIVIDMAPPCNARNTDKVTATVNRTNGTSNGCLYFYLTAPLTSPRTALNLDIVIMARGGNNMRFSVPRSICFGGTSTGPAIQLLSFQGEKDVKRFEGLRVVDQNVEVTESHFSQKEQQLPTAAIHFGEEVLSLRALVQKFAYSGTFKVDGQSSGSGNPPPFVMFRCPPLPPQLSASSNGNYRPLSTQNGTYKNPFTWVSFYSALFAGCRGSCRVKVPTLFDQSVLSVQMESMCSGDAQYYNNTIITAADWNVAYGNGGCVWITPSVSSFGQGSSLEFTVPYYCPLKMVSTLSKFFNPVTLGGAESYVLGDMQGVGALFFGGAMPNVPQSYNSYGAAGPDYTVGRFRRVPAMNTF